MTQLIISLLVVLFLGRTETDPSRRPSNALRATHLWTRVLTHPRRDLLIFGLLWPHGRVCGSITLRSLSDCL